MAKYSRVEKYKDLRDRIQNDADDDYRSRDLSAFESRLNQINSQNFDAPKSYSTVEDHDPIHARRRQVDEAVPVQKADVRPAQSTSSIDFGPSAFRNGNENYTNLLNNEFLNEYINEVKQYNVDQGNAMSTNTDLDILKSLRGDRPVQAPKKPYPEEPYRPVQQQAAVKPVIKPEDKTMDIPFFSDGEDDNDRPVGTATGMSREDIAAEVQNLIRGQGEPMDADAKTKTYTNVLDDHLEADRTARQRLLNETSQMRAQLDDYEDNLTEVSDKMQHTNNVLNIVLVVLIAVLLVVLGVVIYWILMSKGVF